MPLIENEDIGKLVDLFSDRNVYFHHSCQLSDFKSYVQLGGIPSRNLMESNSLNYTKFDTDESDQQKDVWNLIFGNLWDYGSTFAKRKWGEESAPVPNPYGPITIIFSPVVFREVQNISISLKSAGYKNFDRIQDGLSLDDIPRIFHCIDCKYPHETQWIKFSDDLKAEFKISSPGTLNPEVSCMSLKECLSASNIHKIIVDKISVRGVSLIYVVKDILKSCRKTYAVYPRSYHPEFGHTRKNILSNIVNLAIEGYLTFEEIYNHNKCDDESKIWMDKVKCCGIKYQFDRYIKYLKRGTLDDMDQFKLF